MAAVYQSNLFINPRPIISYNTFENLTLSFSHPDWKTEKPLLFAVVYRPPAPYSEFLVEISDFLTSLVLKYEKVIIVGDFNIHVDVNNDCLASAFTSLLDSIGFSQNVNKPTHSFNHTLDLVLTYGIEADHITVFPQNPVLSDHSLITFEFTLTNFSVPGKKFHYSRCLSDTAISEFKERIPAELAAAPCSNIVGGSFADFSPPQIDYIVDSTAAALIGTLDAVAPMRIKNITNQKRVAPWYNSNLRALKQKARRLERKSHSSQREEDRQIWKCSILTYKKELRNARSAYYSSLIENNKNNPRFLFNTVARLTKNHSAVEPCIPLTLSSNKFLTFFTEKILNIRAKIGSNTFQTTVPLESPPSFSPQLDSFSPIELPELTSVIRSSKSSTCLLDPVPTSLLKDIFPLINVAILNQINLSLVTGYVPQSFKVAVIKPLLKKPSLDPEVLANYRPISNLPYISKILEKVVLAQLHEHLLSNDLYEAFQSGFREHHSTETALVRVSNDLLIASDRGLVSVLVLLDLSAAFDTIDHSILLQRMHHEIGIKLTSYLSDRYQFVNVNSDCSVGFHMACHRVRC